MLPGYLKDSVQSTLSVEFQLQDVGHNLCLKVTSVFHSACIFPGC